MREGRRKKKSKSQINGKRGEWGSRGAEGRMLRVRGDEGGRKA